MSIAISLHLLAAIVWVGGMFFAYMALRPVAASLLEPPQRLSLWAQVFAKFFPWVWLAVILLLASGYWMVFMIFGGFAGTRTYVHAMHGLGLLMIAIYAFVYFKPYQGLKRSVSQQDWPGGGKQLATIRTLVGTNLLLGIFTAIIAAAGRYL